MYTLELILLVYFAFVTGYSIIFSIAALFYKTKKAPETRLLNKVAVLIPAYKEDGVIVGVAEQALKQNYPTDKFDVVIIADSLKSTTLEKLRALPIKVIEVVFEKSTKVRALNRAMEVLGDNYDCAVVLDADNVMEHNFIRKMNNLFNIRYKAIQGRRAPKNENTTMALLDGLSETINNFIFRQGSVAMGMSSPMNGSGMFFEYKAFKNIIGSMDAVGGFDRELEYKFIEHKMPVHYARDIVVFDEKVENPEVFQRQRTRWLSSQFVYLKKYFAKGVRSLFRGNFSYFHATVLRNLMLPRVMNLGLLGLTLILSIVFLSYVKISPMTWFALLILNAIAILLAIPKRLYNVQLLKSVLLIPTVFLRMVAVFFRLKGANKTFIHTPHGNIAHTDKAI
jgi:cellulose synthase/poly-beta-1,6-N-acetylglucosamine synthase-like glycosyltransferase